MIVGHCDGRRAAYHLRPVASRDNPVLFVYGSLKRGGRHHAELRGAPFLGEASTAPGYALEELGEYVALVPRPHALGSVPGEVYQVDAELLAWLDEFEGPDYRRALIELVPRGEPAELRAAHQTADPAERSEADETMGRFGLAYLRRTR
jgi:gamma-glutamylcyclotransferase (GGCT)/AIG2-like uncharacterized protein YtfP